MSSDTPKQNSIWDILCTNVICSIRSKTLVTVLIAFLVFYAVILGLILGVFPDTFLKFEYTNINQASRRINRVLKDQADDLAKFTTQYIAAWDTSFLTWNNLNSGVWNQTNLDGYMNDNWADAQFITFHIDFVAYYLLDGTMRQSRTYDIDAGSLDTQPLPDELSTFPSAWSKLNLGDTSTRAQGFLSPKDRNITYLIVAVPIQSTIFQGPVPALIIVGRRLNSRTNADIALRSQLCITQYYSNNQNNWQTLYDNSIVNIKTNALSSSFNLITPNITDTTWQDKDENLINTLVKMDNMTTTLTGRSCWASSQADDQIPANKSSLTIPTERLAGFNAYSDINGKFALMIRVDVNRSVRDLSTFATLTVLLILLAVGIAFFFLIEILLEVLVLCRMTRLTIQIKNIHENEKDSNNVVTTTGGFDEIGYLSQNINEMLGTIRESQSQLIAFVNRLGQEEEKTRIMLNTMPDCILIFNSTGKITKMNSTFEKIFYSAQELEEKAIFDILTQLKKEDLEDATCNNVETIASGKFGVKIPVSVSTTKIEIFVEEVKTNQVMIVIRDMRERKDAQDKLEKEKRALEELEQQMEFEATFREPILREAFTKFCTKEKTVENVLLLAAIENYKKMDQAKRPKKQKTIYEKFLKTGAEHAVNISKKTLDEAIDKAMNGVGQVDLFSSLEKAIKFNLIGESFSRFQSVRNEYIDEVLKEIEEDTKSGRGSRSSRMYGKHLG
jgi:PAS domain S-box-containing protein